MELLVCRDCLQWKDNEKNLLDPGQAVRRNHSYRQWCIRRPSVAWGGKSLWRKGRWGEAERGGIGTWGRCGGKEKEEKYRRNSRWTGRYVREKSLWGRGDGQMDNKVFRGKGWKVRRERERLGKGANTKKDECGDGQEKRQRQRKKHKRSKWWGARAQLAAE